MRGECGHPTIHGPNGSGDGRDSGTHRRDWGKDALLDLSDPSIANNDEARRTFARYFRLAASPGAALTVLRLQTQIDVRHVLPAIHVPALVMHRKR